MSRKACRVGSTNRPSEAEATHPTLVPAEMVSQLVAQGPLDLPGEQVPVVAEVTFQRVAVDDDPVLVAFPRDAVAEVLAVRVLLGPTIRDHDSDLGQHLLEFVGQPVDRVDDQGLEVVELRTVGHDTNGRGSSYPHGAMILAELETLPGASLVRGGLADLDEGRESAEALLVSVGAPRLRSLGIELPKTIASPEHKLYALLAREKGDAGHSAYNALIRRLVSFERAAACAS
jgi:hypothetical protein